MIILNLWWSLLLIGSGWVIGIIVGIQIGKSMLEKKLHIVTGKNAKRFYENINDKEITPKQQKFLDDCVKLYDKMKK